MRRNDSELSFAQQVFQRPAERHSGATWQSSLPPAYSDAALACEHVILGAVLVNNKRYGECVRAGVRAGDFLSTLHNRLWREMGALIQAGLEASPLTLAPRLAGDREYEVAGGHRYLGKLAVASAGSGDVRSHVVTLRNWSARRALYDLGEDLHDASESGRVAIDTVLGQAREKLDACQLPIADGEGLQDFAVLLDQALEANRQAAERGTLDGVPFGLSALDDMLGGIARSDLTVVAGRPGMGKSAFGLSVALFNAHQGRAVAFFSMEMSALQMTNRVLAQCCGVAADRMRKGALGPAELERMAAARDGLQRLKLAIDATGALKPEEVLVRVQQHAERQPVELIVIDYAQLMSPPQRSENRVQDMTQITNGLKAMAKRLNVPVLLLSQLNRGPEHRDSKRPMMADLRESGSLEQDADQVVLLYREQYYALQEEPQQQDLDAHRAWLQRLRDCAGKAELIVAKNRHGATGTVTVGFDGLLTRFFDLVPA